MFTEVYKNNMEYPSLGTPPAGSIRFNTDSSKMEIYNGDKWWEIDATSPEAQTGGTRGVFGGGFVQPATYSDVIDYFNVATTGNAIDFGNVTDCKMTKGVASRSRGVFMGGETSPAAYKNSMEYITISSTGNITNFGDMTISGRSGGSVSNETRGVYLQGQTGSVVNTIQFITIAATGNAVDFGDVVSSHPEGSGSNVSSPTRGCIAGGGGNNSISYITIATQGNSSDFGDRTVAGQCRGASNAVRGLWMGSNSSPKVDVGYITIASLGNAADFGDLLKATPPGGACASPTKVVAGGGWISPADQNGLEYHQILSTGNFIDFGDLTVARDHCGSLSNGHGGLG